MVQFLATFKEIKQTEEHDMQIPCKTLKIHDKERKNNEQWKKGIYFRKLCSVGFD